MLRESLRKNDGRFPGRVFFLGLTASITFRRISLRKTRWKISRQGILPWFDR